MTEEDSRKFAERKDNSPIVWRLMNSNILKRFLSYYTPKFFATQGLKVSVYDQKLANIEHAMQFHDLVLLEGSRNAILSMSMGSRSKMHGPESLSRIEAPTLVIHGDKDNIIPIERSQVFEEYIDKVEVKIYSQIGHLPMYEDPNKTANDIKSFLQNLN